MKRGGGITGWYAVRVSSGIGWAFYKENRLARLRSAFEGHCCVGYMTSADAGHFIDRMGEAHA